MFTGQVAVVSNTATWQSPVFELLDEDNNDAVVDLSAVGLTVDVSVFIKDFNGCTLATATIANGKAIIVAPGFQWQFEVADLSNICAGTYKCGAKITINNVVTDLIDGTIAVVEGLS